MPLPLRTLLLGLLLGQRLEVRLLLPRVVLQPANVLQRCTQLLLRSVRPLRVLRHKLYAGVPNRCQAYVRGKVRHVHSVHL